MAKNHVILIIGCLLFTVVNSSAVLRSFLFQQTANSSIANEVKVDTEVPIQFAEGIQVKGIGLRLKHIQPFRDHDLVSNTSAVGSGGGLHITNSLPKNWSYAASASILLPVVLRI